MMRKFFTLLGFAAKAGKISFGHDAAKQSIRAKKAAAICFSADAAVRLREELTGLGTDIPVYYTKMTSAETEKLLGKRAAVFTVNDNGFADSLNKYYHTAENKEDHLCP